MDRARVLALTVGLALAAPAAHAVTLQQIVVGTFNGPSAASFAPFDPALGTLDKVTVSVVGTLVLQGTTAPNLSQPGSVPVPFPVSAVVDQDFLPVGVGGLGFQASSRAKFFLNGIAPGTGGLVTLSRPFTYDMVFDDLADLIGFDIPDFSGADVPPVSMIGVRAAFLELPPPFDGFPIEISVLDLVGTLTGFISATASSAGSMVVTYTYTTPPVDVAEPGTLGLLAFGALGLLRLRRRY